MQPGLLGAWPLRPALPVCPRSLPASSAAGRASSRTHARNGRRRRRPRPSRGSPWRLHPFRSRTAGPASPYSSPCGDPSPPRCPACSRPSRWVGLGHTSPWGRLCTSPESEESGSQQGTQEAGTLHPAMLLWEGPPGTPWSTTPPEPAPPCWVLRPLVSTPATQPSPQPGGLPARITPTAPGKTEALKDPARPSDLTVDPRHNPRPCPERSVPAPVTHPSITPVSTQNPQFPSQPSRSQHSQAGIQAR